MILLRTLSVFCFRQIYLVTGELLGLRSFSRVVLLMISFICLCKLAGLDGDIFSRSS